MPAPTTVPDLIELVRKSQLVAPAKLDAYLTTQQGSFETPEALIGRLQADGLITAFHADQLLRGKHRGFFLGRYKVLDRIGLGGMGQVFLAEHVGMKRRVALKVMPPERMENQYSRERFFREARAAGQLDHPNLVRAFDVDQDGSIIFLVMEYVEGVSFQDLVARTGPLDPARAVHYLWQAASGLGFLAERGLIHRDIKPANLLVDRNGVVKILDLGLVRSQSESDDLTRGEGVKILGTADYLAPEQAIDCSRVDGRADIYALGATGYYLFTGNPPFTAAKVAQKLIAHQSKAVKPVHEVRPDVPRELSVVIDRMLAKKPAERFQTPWDVMAALEPFVGDRPVPPTEQEIAGSETGRRPGTVDLNPKAGSRPGGSSVTSGSSIRYDSGGNRESGVRSGLPNPTPNPRPAPALSNTPPPPLPAVASHGAAPQAKAKPDRLPPGWTEAPPPPGPSRLRKRVWVAVAVALALAVGAWDLAVLAGKPPRLSIGSNRTDSPPAPEPQNDEGGGVTEAHR
jgi:serine/threonine protein kinase